MIRVGIAVTDRKIWTGGYNYLLNLVRVSHQHLDDALRPVVFFGDDVEASDVDRFAAVPGTEVVRAVAFRQSRREAAFANAVLRGADPSIRRQFDDSRVDVVLEAAQFFGWRLGRPAVAWLADFQHRLLRHMFTPASYWRREFGFRAQMFSGRSIMLSSEDARGHCETFYPRTRGRTHVVNFAVQAKPRRPVEALRAAADSYGLPAHYFFLPNQFWRHKNHQCVIRALGLLKQAGREITVAASGNPFDRGDPEHWPRLGQLIEEQGVADNFRLLGMIPGDDVAALMQGCAALLNPSISEGWSTTVEEAKAAGTPMILADLPVHREQASGSALFFDPGRPEQLAEILAAYPPMNEAWRCDAAAAAAIASSAAVERYARQFLAVIRDAARNAPR
jgi:glycosyltransferase involved in cell wall biosynthesis